MAADDKKLFAILPTPEQQAAWQRAQLLAPAEPTPDARLVKGELVTLPGLTIVLTQKV